MQTMHTAWYKLYTLPDGAHCLMQTGAHCLMQTVHTARWYTLPDANWCTLPYGAHCLMQTMHTAWWRTLRTAKYAHCLVHSVCKHTLHASQCALPYCVCLHISPFCTPAKNCTKLRTVSIVCTASYTARQHFAKFTCEFKFWKVEIPSTHPRGCACLTMCAHL